MKNLTNNIFVDNSSYIEFLLKYFNSCQTGRSKPDNRSGGTVLESLDNYGELKIIKQRLNAVFNLDQTEIDKINSNTREEMEKRKTRHKNNIPNYKK